jgi:CheY-like chemotaxis protein
LVYVVVGTSTSELLTSISHYLWPVVAAAVLWKLMPVIREVLRTRSYKINVGGLSVDVQTASEGLQKQIADLQNQVARLAESSGASTGAAAGQLGPAIAGEQASTVSPQPAPRPPSGASVLWVDDKPENIAYEMQVLQNNGINVVTATTTPGALTRFYAGHFFSAITDMGRVEDGSYNPQAGLEFVKAVRAADSDIGLYVFTSDDLAIQYQDELLRAGANTVTSSTVQLLAALGVIGGTDAE